jgi:pimeloyl-ACP methyl ester carboxylesterase
MKKIFTHNDISVSYCEFGYGSEVFLCFPGFGRPAEDFEFLTAILNPDQRLVCIDLFAHGESVFPENRIIDIPLEKTEWEKFLIAFIDSKGIDKFGMIGYSMGGRVVLVTMELMYQRINSVLLIAPDGLKINPFYKFASGTKLGRKMYESIIDNPRSIFTIAKWLNKLGMLSDKLHRFVHVHLDTREKRLLVRDAWMIYRKIFPDKNEIARLYKHDKIRFHMIFGEYDSVIVSRLGKKFAAQLGDEKILHILPMGHRILGPELLHYLKENPTILLGR